MTDRDPVTAAYAALGLLYGASRRQVNASYKALSQQFHPDTGNGDDSRQKEISAARDVLTRSSPTGAWTNASSRRRRIRAPAATTPRPAAVTAGANDHRHLHEPHLHHHQVSPVGVSHRRHPRAARTGGARPSHRLPRPHLRRSTTGHRRRHARPTRRRGTTRRRLGGDVGGAAPS